MSVAESKKRNNQGFTLVELSIVLVIIGLIVGGVLVGQDMIRSAEGRALVAQIEKYNAAVSTFRNKYAALPGDITTPTTYISGSAVAGGDGNGFIYSAAGLPTTATPTSIAGSGNELSPFWNHLGLSGLIDGTFDGSKTNTALGTNYPYTKSQRGGIMAYAGTDGNHYWHVGLTSYATDDTITTANNLRPEEAFYVDSKMDDGLPGSGIIRAKGSTTLEGTAGSGTAGSANCVNSTPTPNAYNMISIAPLCQIRIKMSI